MKANISLSLRLCACFGAATLLLALPTQHTQAAVDSRAKPPAVKVYKGDSPEAQQIQKNLMQLQQMNTGYNQFAQAQQMSAAITARQQLQTELISLQNEKSRNLPTPAAKRKARDERISQLEKSLNQ
jgi:hypothetical protein